MTHSDLLSERRVLAAILLAFVGVAVLAAIDVWSDLQEGTTLAHVAAEAGVLLVGMLGAIFIARRLVVILRRARAARREAVELAAQLEDTRAEASRWRSEARELMQGLAAALDTQFDRLPWLGEPSLLQPVRFGVLARTVASARTTRSDVRRSARVLLRGVQDLLVVLPRRAEAPIRTNSHGPDEPEEGAAASIVPWTISVERQNEMVRRHVERGRGIFIQELQRELGRRRLDVRFLAHDLFEELDGHQSNVKLPVGEYQTYPGTDHGAA